MFRETVRRILAWLPRQSILGRIVHPLVDERKTLAGRMSWVGIGIILVFLFIAVFANVLAPWDPIGLSDEQNTPPWTNAAVTRNESFGGWLPPASFTSLGRAQRLDGLGAVSTLANETDVLVAFPMTIHRDVIDRVAVAARLIGNGTDPGHFLRLEVSVDAGRTWSQPFPVRAVNRFEVVDITNLTSWTVEELSTANFQIRIQHASDATVDGNLTVDYVGAVVVWRTHWHLMGTDSVGRDVFSRVLHGTRTSLAIMIIGVSVALVVGFPLGLYSGYRGGWFDRILVLVMDSLYSFPGLLFAGLIAVLLGKGVVNIGLAVTVIYVPLYFRVTRSQVLSAREELYVEAARAIGAPPLRVVFRYIMMNVIVAIPVIFSISAADAILTAAGLSFLGLGVEAPTPDWGLDLSAAANLIDNGIWWSSFFPGFVIVVLTVGLSFLGEGLNDIVNPLLQKERS